MRERRGRIILGVPRGKYELKNKTPVEPLSLIHI